MSAGPEIPWDDLRRRAVEVAQLAYAPYSRFPVGAAGLASTGQVVVGCNVENASIGLTLCAECGLVSALAASGGGRLVAVAIRKADGEPVLPCGRCRQVLWEVGGAECLVDGNGSVQPLSSLLPGAFDATQLPAP